MKVLNSWHWKAIGSVACALVFASANSQTLGKNRPAPSRSAVQADASFVTKAEAIQVLTKVRQVVYRIVLKSAPPKSALPITSAVCSRKELVETLHAWFIATTSEFKATPRQAIYDPAQLSIQVGDPSRAKLEKLVSWGFIGRVDPLATSTKAGLTPEEFGDAIGYFLCRLSDLTHTPSIQYSPNMMGGGEGG